MDAELNSQNSSAPGETGGQSPVCESSVARSLGSEAPTLAAAADAASGGGSLATGARDEGQAKAVITQLVEPSVDAEKNSPAGKTGRAREIGGSVAFAPFDAAAVDPLREASAARDGRTLLKRSRTHWRPLIAGIMRRLRGFLRRSARKPPLPRM
jgi:hypothetical protein